jgi:hypothetical protein
MDERCGLTGEFKKAVPVGQTIRRAIALDAADQPLTIKIDLNK